MPDSPAPPRVARCRYLVTCKAFCTRGKSNKLRWVLLKRFSIKFINEQEEAMIAVVLMEHVAKFPEHKADPTFKSLFKKFNGDIDRMLRGLDAGVRIKV